MTMEGKKQRLPEMKNWRDRCNTILLTRRKQQPKVRDLFFFFSPYFWIATKSMEGKKKKKKVQVVYKTERFKNNHRIASGICTNSALGLRHKYKQWCVCRWYRSSVLAAISNTAQPHCLFFLIKEVNWREKAKVFQALCVVTNHPPPSEALSFYLVIISFGCKQVIIVLLRKIYRYIPIRKATKDDQ